MGGMHISRSNVSYCLPVLLVFVMGKDAFQKKKQEGSTRI